MEYVINFPTSFQAVDIIVEYKPKIFAFGSKKKDNGLLRTFGGFVDPADPTLEFAAKRELSEESGIKNLSIIPNPSYLFNFRVDDDRYVNSPHKVMSAVFYVNLVKSPILLTPCDDIDSIELIAYDEILNNQKRFIKPHAPIINFLIKNLNK